MVDESVYVEARVRASSRQEAMAMLKAIANSVVMGATEGTQERHITSGWFHFRADDITAEEWERMGPL